MEGFINDNLSEFKIDQQENIVHVNNNITDADMSFTGYNITEGFAPTTPKLNTIQEVEENVVEDVVEDAVEDVVEEDVIEKPVEESFVPINETQSNIASFNDNKSNKEKFTKFESTTTTTGCGFKFNMSMFTNILLVLLILFFIFLLVKPGKKKSPLGNAMVPIDVIE